MPLAPGGTGFLGHNAEFRRDRMGMLRKLTQVSEPVARLKLPAPGVRAMVALDPDVVQEILVEKAKSFKKSDMLRFSLFPLAGEGLFTSNGELWRRQRKLMAPLFHPKALEAYAPDMVGCAMRTVDGWEDGQELSLAAETTHLAMAIAGKTLFGADTFTEADSLGHALTVTLDWAGWVIGRPLAIGHVMLKRAFSNLAKSGPEMLKPYAEKGALATRGPIALIGKRGREVAKAVVVLDQQVQRLIDDRRAASTSHEDLLARLLTARDEDGERMSDRQIRDEILTLFVAGHETTATGLAWTIHEACKDPKVYAEMEREADAVGDSPTVNDLGKLDMCLRAFKEALRLYPPVYMFGRDSIDQVSLGGYDLQPPTNTLVSPWVIQRLPRLWKDAERFDPERFRPEQEAKRHRYAYLPFSAGPRFCLGIHFAYMEAPLVLAVLLRRYRFELVESDVPEPSATLRPKAGVKVRVRRRS